MRFLGGFSIYCLVCTLLPFGLYAASTSGNNASYSEICGLKCGTEYAGKWLVCPEETEVVGDVYYCNGESWEKNIVPHLCHFAPGEGYVTATINVTAEFVIWVHSDKRQRYYMFNDSSEFCYSCRQGYELTWGEPEPRCIPFSKNSATLSRPCSSYDTENDWCKPFATGATDGRCRYLKSGDVTQLTCATINCADDYYLWLNDKGNSQGICHSQSTAQKRCDGKCNNCDGTCVPNVVDTPTFKVNDKTVTPRPNGAYQGCKCEALETGEKPSEADEPVKTEYATNCTTSGGTIGEDGKCACSGDKGLAGPDENGKCTCSEEGAEYNKDIGKCEKTEIPAGTSVSTPESSNDHCEKSGGAPQTDGTCTCDINNNLKPNEDNTKCICADSFSRENETDPCTPTNKGNSGAKDETDETKANTNPELEEKLKSAKDALAAAKEKENSWANRGVTAASSAMTGLGGMAAASAYSEQKSDAEAEKEMRAYIETMKCEYGNGQNIKFGNEEITLPGGNELLEYYTEYKSLADELKQTKTALGLRPGIESETLYDRAQSGLYQYASTGKTGGGETSLYRALTDSESADATAWAEQKEKTDKKLLTGGLVAAAGVATGVIGNYLVNERGNKNDTNETDIDEIAARAGNALGRNRNNNVQPEQPPASAQVSQTMTITWRKMFKSTNSTDIDANGGNNQFAISVKNIVKALQSDTTGADTQCVTVRSRPSNFAEILKAKYEGTLSKQFTKSKIEYRVNNTEITDTACKPSECPNIYINVRNKPCGEDVRIPNNTKVELETVTVEPPKDPQPDQPRDTLSTRIINQWKQEFRDEHYKTYEITNDNYAKLFEFIKGDENNSYYTVLKAKCDELIEAQERYDWHIAGDKKVLVGEYGTVVIDKYICDGYH